jgi:Protein of unknown function (DUF429)
MCTASGVATPGLMEVYPHAALLALSGDAVRLAYKAGKTTTYWPSETAQGRRAPLLAAWARIVAMLDREISGVSAALPLPTEEKGRKLKAYEDRLDSVICAYVAIEALKKRAEAYGDESVCDLGSKAAGKRKMNWRRIWWLSGFDLASVKQQPLKIRHLEASLFHGDDKVEVGGQKSENACGRAR